MCKNPFHSGSFISILIHWLHHSFSSIFSLFWICDFCCCFSFYHVFRDWLLFLRVMCFASVDRIFPKEHFKEKYAVDEVHYICDVSLSCWCWSLQPVCVTFFLCSNWTLMLSHPAMKLQERMLEPPQTVKGESHLSFIETYYQKMTLVTAGTRTSIRTRTLYSRMCLGHMHIFYKSMYNPNSSAV